MRRLLLMVLAGVLVATPLIAGPPGLPGWRFSNDQNANTANEVPGTAGTLNMRVHMKLTGAPGSLVANASTTTDGLAPFSTGREIASQVATALCAAADADANITCGSFTGGVAGCVFSAAAGVDQSATCTSDTAPAGRGFRIYQAASPFAGFRLEEVGAATFKSGTSGAQLDRTDGGSFAADLLDTWNFRIRPLTNGVVTFTTPGAPGGSGTNPFTVDTTAFPGASTPGSAADFNLHKAICDKYSAIGIFTILHSPPDTDAFFDTANVSGGYSIELVNPPSVTEFEVKPVAGQTIATQLSGADPPAASVPALSEWGMLVLIALLVLSGIWMIRRRQPQTT